MRLADLADKNVLIWGGGREASSVIRAAAKNNIEANFTVLDEAVDGPNELEGVPIVRGDDVVAAIEAAEVIVRSPGVSRYHPALVELTAQGVAITTPTNLWFAEDHTHVIAVTGTKGKSTTSSLIAHFLTHLGRETILAGNIGVSPVEYIGQPEPDEWVVELSSFQASELNESPDIGVLTTLSPEHLDWHGDFETYVNDKLTLFANSETITSVLNFADQGVRDIAGRVPNLVASEVPDGVHAVGGWFMVADAKLFETEKLTLAGDHNIYLTCLALTAVAACGFDLVESADTLAKALGLFTALPHRLETVATHNGVTFVDDGLATNPLATIAALAAFADRPVAVLVGGHDRGVSYNELGLAITGAPNKLTVITMPENGPRIAAEIEAERTEASQVEVKVSEGLEDAVGLALEAAEPGSVVLLSPAAASFGAFKDYVERSEAFVEIVNRLAPQTGSDNS